MKSRQLLPWLFLSPALILLFAFSFWPVIYGAYLSLTDFGFLRPVRFIGLENYRQLFDNALFISGLKNSLLCLLVVPFTQIGALALATLVNQKLPLISWFRTAFYVPVVTSVAVVGIMWSYMLHENGLLNFVLLQLHLINAPIGWLSNDQLAMFAIMFVALWRGIGWYMVMYLAALQAVPADVIEAARLDGANAWQRFWKITVPLVFPTILICTVMSILAALKIYQEVDVLTQGGPMNSTFTALYYAYDQGLKHIKLPRGLAASFIMSIVCILIASVGYLIVKRRRT